MTIRRQLYISAWIFGAVVFAVLLTLILSSREIDLALERSRSAADIATNGIGGLRAVTVDYILNHEQRALKQWQQRQATLRRMLAADLYDDTGRQSIIDDLHRHNESLGEILPKLTSLYAVRSSDHALEQTLNKLERQAEARLVTQLMATTQDMISDAARLLQNSRERLRKVQRRARMIVFIEVTIMALLIAANLLLAIRVVLNPIRVLQRGAESVGAGDLKHRTSIGLDNEIGTLSRAFDAMTAKLDQSQAKLEANAIGLQEANDALASSSRDLARSNAELAQFAYVASHDLQEPLRMVTGYVQLLEQRLAGKLDADTREFMGFAVDGAMRMQALILDILAYSRVSNQGATPAPVASAAALREALARLANRIDETGAQVEAASLPVVMADRTQLAQLFQNLVGNAIKFCKDRAPRVRVDAAHEPGRWRFSVTDNGIGIAPEHRAQLFVIFKRLHTRREYPGTGIGLAICKRIVERHGGEIGIESAPGGGSVFWFTLPEEKST